MAPFTYATGKGNASRVDNISGLFPNTTGLLDVITNSSLSDMITNSTLPSNHSDVATTTPKPWSDGVSIGVPVFMILLFVLVQIIAIFVKNKESHIPMRVPIRIHVSSKNDIEEKSAPPDEKKTVTISPDKDEIFGEDPAEAEARDERTIETTGDVDRMRQHAKEQAKKSRKGRQISLKSITSIVSRNSSQFEYSELEEQDPGQDNGEENQLGIEVEEDSDAEVDTTGAAGDLADGASKRDSSMITVMVEHHSPPKHLLVDIEGASENLMTHDDQL